MPRRSRRRSRRSSAIPRGARGWAPRRASAWRPASRSRASRRACSPPSTTRWRRDEPPGLGHRPDLQPGARPRRERGESPRRARGRPRGGGGGRRLDRRHRGAPRRPRRSARARRDPPARRHRRGPQRRHRGRARALRRLPRLGRPCAPGPPDRAARVPRRVSRGRPRDPERAHAAPRGRSRRPGGAVDQAERGARARDAPDRRRRGLPLEPGAAPGHVLHPPRARRDRAARPELHHPGRPGPRAARHAALPRRLPGRAGLRLPAACGRRRPRPGADPRGGDPPRREARARASRGPRPARAHGLRAPPGAPLGASGERAARGGRRARRARGAGRGARAPPGERRLSPARALARAARPGVRVRIAFMHRRLAGGGTEADLRRMAAGLAARGHEVHVFAARVDAAPPGVTLRRVPVVRAGRLARLLSFAALAPRLVAHERWDVVVGFGRTPRQDVVRVGGGTHRSYLARMEAAGLRGGWRGPYHRAILRLEARAFAPGAYRRVLAVSERVRDEVAADYHVPPERIRVLYNGVDLERFHPARRGVLGPVLRRALGLVDGERVSAAIGSGFARKGFDLLLRLWREAPPRDTALVLVGDDERLASYRRQAEALGRRVRVTGPRPDVEAVLAAADVACLPSRQEAFGNVVLEACAAGVPVVTARRAGAAELLRGPLAALVVDDPEDLVALARALAHALGPEHDALAHAARARAEDFPWDEHLDRLEALLAEVARGR